MTAVTPAEGAEDVLERLRAACVGHPTASIPWPHRLLHDAAQALAEARAEMERLRFDRDSWRRTAEVFRTEAIAAEAEVAALTAENKDMKTALDFIERECGVMRPERNLAALEAQNAKMRAALERLRDCDWVITLPDRMDAVRAIARAALEKPHG